MMRSIRGLLCFLLAILVLPACKKEFREFYERPTDLAPPIYQVLQQRGNFNTLLSVIEKAGYKDILGASGYWTFFAPNDEAFNRYFSDKGLSVDKLSAEHARKIVAYALVYNAFDSVHVADYQSPSGWVLNDAYKRRTAYYDGFYTNAAQDSAFVAQNTNGTGYIFGDDNNKYIPFFHSKFMTAQNLSESDYKYFFPKATYTGFNVVQASVVKQNIYAENGIVHEINEVVEPLPSIEQKLISNSDYSSFRSFFDRYMIRYVKDENMTRRYLSASGKNTPVYIKTYGSELAYSPGNEGFMRVFVHDAQTDGYTMFAPSNTAFNTYLNNVILEFYGSIDKLPSSIVADLMNAHMWQTTVWPSKFANTTSFLAEPARFNPALTSNGGNIIENQFCSNGIFYGTNKVQEANVFSTVYARAYLDPEYSIMTRLLNQNGRIPFISPGLKYTFFMLPDSKLRALGFDYSPANANFTQTVGTTTTIGGQATLNLLRILNMNILPFQQKDLSGNGIGETNQGEYIRWDNNRVYSAGTIEKGFTLTVDPSKSRDYVNGTVHFLNSTNENGNAILDFPTAKVAKGIELNAGTLASPGNYFDFWEYLRQSTAYDPAAQEIIGLQLGANYTVLIPTRSAMKAAVEAGLLPGTKDGNGKWLSFTYNPASQQDKELVQRFINYHIIKEVSVAADGIKGGPGSNSTFPTLLRNTLGDPVNIRVINQSTTRLTFTDTKGISANIIAPNTNSYLPATSNHLGHRVIYHLIDNYLEYTL